MAPNAMTPGNSLPTPTLPLELWLRVFENTPDPAHLWLQGRRVCRTWRSRIPSIVAQQFLPQVSLNYDGGWQLRAGMTTQLYIVLKFDRFDSGDGGRCVFKQTSTRTGHGHTSRHPHAFTKIWDAWPDLVERYLRDPLQSYGHDTEPWHVLELNGHANDTELLNVELKLDPREASFDWFSMLDVFFRELFEQESRSKSLAVDLNINFYAGMQHGLYPHPAVTSTRLFALYSLHVMVRKQLRRERLSRILGRSDWYCDDGGKQDQGRETEALQRVMDHVGKDDIFGCFDEATLSGNTASRRRRSCR